MPSVSNEDNTFEQMTLAAFKENGWKYIPSEELPRQYSDVMAEPTGKAALVRLNSKIEAEPSRANEVIYKLMAVIFSVQPHNLVTQNEVFKRLILKKTPIHLVRTGA